jgi:hypothetical protein
MTTSAENVPKISTLQIWLISLSVLGLSFGGFVLALICIFSIPGKSFPLEGSFYFIGSSILIVGLLFLLSKKAQCQSIGAKDEQGFVSSSHKLSDKLLTWGVSFYSFVFVFFGLILSLICIFALPNKTAEPAVGAVYFVGSAGVLGSFVYVLFKRTA